MDSTRERINFLGLRYPKTISIQYVYFCILFPSLAFVFGNFSQLGTVKKWFSNSNGNDLFGYTIFLLIAILLNIAIFTVFSHRKIIKITSVIFLILISVPAYFTSKYQVAIDRSVLTNIFGANTTDIRSFLSFQMIPHIVVTIVAPALLLNFIRIDFGQRKSRYLISTLSIILGTMTMAVSLLYLQFNSISRAMNSSNRVVVQTLAPINIIQSLGSIAQVSTQEFFRKRKNMEFKGSIAKQEDLVVVLAIGETARQKNFSLYGYDKNNTNPLLSKVHNLYALNAKARYGSTMYALPEILNKNGLPLPFVTQKMGIETSCYVNFTMYEACESVGEVQVKNCPPDGNCYDGDLVPLLIENLKSYKSGSRLVLLHLGGGSHGPNYQLRYPPDFQKFKPLCADADVVKNCNESELYNSYDNTILYTDFVINGAISELDKSGLPYVFIYISDHGESLLEDGRVFHGMPIGQELPQEQADIPLLIKSSIPIQIKNQPEYLQRDIFDTVTSLFSIEGDMFDKKASFIQRKK